MQCLSLSMKLNSKRTEVYDSNIKNAKEASSPPAPRLNPSKFHIVSTARFFAIKHLTLLENIETFYGG